MLHQYNFVSLFFFYRQWAAYRFYRLTLVILSWIFMVISLMFDNRPKQADMTRRSRQPTWRCAVGCFGDDGTGCCGAAGHWPLCSRFATVYVRRYGKWKLALPSRIEVCVVCVVKRLLYTARPSFEKQPNIGNMPLCHQISCFGCVIVWL